VTAPDISSWNHNALLDYTKLVAQDGRMLLASDLNRSSAIVEERVRTSDYDLSPVPPLAGVRELAWVPLSSPDALLIDGVNQTIGRGSFHLDGHVLRVHGTGAISLDPVREGPQLASAQPIDSQPYLLSSSLWPGRPEWPVQGRHLAYVVAATRQVDSLIDKGLVDVAFGLDTALPEQLAWQVRTLPLDPDVTVTPETPDADIPGWVDLIAPSGGLLTVSGMPAADNSDPCELPDIGGPYPTDNYLMRVEVVTAGHLADAEFVYSRFNASLWTPVAAVMSARIARVDTIGRDDVLSFRPGDLVQLVDEIDQLASIGEPTRPQSRFARVKYVHPEDLTIEVETDLFDVLPAPDTQVRKTRLVKWDNPAKVLDTVGTDVTATVSPAGMAWKVLSTDTLLQDGILVRFGEQPNGRGFLVGDYWTFAVRYDNASVENLTDAIPRGSYRHYARLAVIDGESVIDLRRKPCQTSSTTPTPVDEDDCDCCDIIVCAGGRYELAEAIKIVSDRDGGVVRICPGAYLIPQSIRLQGIRNVIVRGSGPATVLYSQEEMFVAEATTDVTFENFRAVSARSVLVAGGASSQITLRDVRFTTAAADEPNANGDDRRRVAAPVVGLNGVMAGLRIEGCELNGVIGLGVWPGTVDRPTSPLHWLADLTVENTLLLCSSLGIDLGSNVRLSGTSRVERSTVVGGASAGIVLSGRALAEFTPRILLNRLAVSGDGIVIGATDSTVAENSIMRLLQPDAEEANARNQAIGIRVSTARASANDDELTAVSRVDSRRGDVVLRDNRVLGFGFAILTDAALNSLAIESNVIETCGAGVIVYGRRGEVSVRGNRVLSLRPRASASVVGIAVWSASTVQIASNLIDAAVARQGDDGREILGQGVAPNVAKSRGISVAASAETQISTNIVRNLGSSAGEVDAIGIEVLGPFGSVSINSNTVSPFGCDDPRQPDERSSLSWQALRVIRDPWTPNDPTLPAILGIADGQSPPLVRGLGILNSKPADNGGTAQYAVVTEDGADIIATARGRVSVGVGDNDFRGVPASVLHPGGIVEILVAAADGGYGPIPDDAGVVRFDANSVTGFGHADGDAPTRLSVTIDATVASATGNTLLDGNLVVTVPSPKFVSLAGNIAPSFDKRWLPFNSATS